MRNTLPPPHSISLMYSFSFNHQLVVLLPLVLIPSFSVASSHAQQLRCDWPWASHLSCSLPPSPNILSFFHPLVPSPLADSKLCPLFSSVNSCFAMNFYLLFPTFDIPHNLSRVSTLTDLSSTNHSWVNVASLSKTTVCDLPWISLNVVWLLWLPTAPMDSSAIFWQMTAFIIVRCSPSLCVLNTSLPRPFTTNFASNTYTQPGCGPSMASLHASAQ